MNIGLNECRVKGTNPVEVVAISSVSSALLNRIERVVSPESWETGCLRLCNAGVLTIKSLLISPIISLSVAE